MHTKACMENTELRDSLESLKQISIAQRVFIVYKKSHLSLLVPRVAGRMCGLR